jgi:VanZ family protein
VASEGSYLRRIEGWDVTAAPEVATVDGPRRSPGATPGVDVGGAGRIDRRGGHVNLAVQNSIERPPWIESRVESGYINAAVLISLAFLYASSVPFIFVVPDYGPRLWGALTSFPSTSEEVLDLTANVLAFVPVGFLWSAAWNTSSTRRSRLRSFAAPALTCLGLATLAEGLQVWIPLRDPSVRDVLSLECGAIAGLGVWAVVGGGITRASCRVIGSLGQSGRGRLFRLQWPMWGAAVFLACVIVIRYAGPIHFFLLYRDWSASLQHLPHSPADLHGHQLRQPHWAVATSAVISLVVVATCRIAQGAVRSLKGDRVQRPEGRCSP